MEKKTPINLALDGLDIFDEFAGKEIEEKIEFYPRRPDLVIQLLKKIIETNNNPLFKLVPNKEKILTWTYYFDRYGYKEKYNFVEAYVIIYHPKKEKFWIKVKGPPKKKEKVKGLLVRREDIVRVERKMRQSDVDLILQLKKLGTGKEIIFLGTIKRYKAYLLLQNCNTGRYYSVSADRCYYKKFRLSQIEIEYKGMEKGKRIRMTPSLIRKLVSQEVFMLSEFLIKNLGSYFKLKKTNQTKFEWLCSCLDREKNR